MYLIHANVSAEGEISMAASLPSWGEEDEKHALNTRSVSVDEEDNVVTGAVLADREYALLSFEGVHALVDEQFFDPIVFSWVVENGGLYLQNDVSDFITGSIFLSIDAFSSVESPEDVDRFVKNIHEGLYALLLHNAEVEDTSPEDAEIFVREYVSRQVTAEYFPQLEGALESGDD